MRLASGYLRLCCALVRLAHSMATEWSQHSVGYLSVFVANFNTRGIDQHARHLLQAAYDETAAGIHMFQNHHGHPELRQNHTSVRDVNTGMVTSILPALGSLEGRASHEGTGWHLLVTRAVLTKPRATMSCIALVNVNIFSWWLFHREGTSHHFWDVLAQIVHAKRSVLLAGHIISGASLVAAAMDERNITTNEIMVTRFGLIQDGLQCMFMLHARGQQLPRPVPQPLLSPDERGLATQGGPVPLRDVITRAFPSLRDRWIPHLQEHGLLPVRPITVIFRREGDAHLRSAAGQARHNARARDRRAFQRAHPYRR